MLKSFLTLFCITFLTIPLNADAKQKLVIDQSTIKRGTKMTYQSNDGKKYFSTVVDKKTFVNSSGKTRKANADGNTLSNANIVFSPHSGYRPPGAGGFFKVGMSWEHDYKSNGVSRHRKCKVLKSGTFKNRYIIVEKAFLVKCTNQRKDRQRPMFEEIWFVPGLLTELSYKAKWTGGGFSHQIIGVE